MKILNSLLVLTMSLSSFGQVQIGADIDGEAADDQSGWSVSLSDDGTIVAVGAPYNDGNGTDAGHVRVYQRAFGVGIEETNILNLIPLSPNPNNGQFRIEIDQEHIGSTYRIVDGLGRLIDTGILTQRIQDFDLSDKPKGVYQVQVSNEKTSKTLNVVIQ